MIESTKKILEELNYTITEKKDGTIIIRHNELPEITFKNELSLTAYFLSKFTLKFKINTQNKG